MKLSTKISLFETLKLQKFDEMFENGQKTEVKSMDIP